MPTKKKLELSNARHFDISAKWICAVMLLDGCFVHGSFEKVRFIYRTPDDIE
jgi:2-methylcitrate dehydratase PrpD